MGELGFIVEFAFGIERTERKIIHIRQQGMRLVADAHHQRHIPAIVQLRAKTAEFKVLRNIFYFIQVVKIDLNRCGHSIQFGKQISANIIHFDWRNGVNLKQ